MSMVIKLIFWATLEGKVCYCFLSDSCTYGYLSVVGLRSFSFQRYKTIRRLFLFIFSMVLLGTY